MHVPHSDGRCHLFTQQVFTEHLLSARHSQGLWEYHTEQNEDSTPGDSTNLKGGRQIITVLRYREMNL